MNYLGILKIDSDETLCYLHTYSLSGQLASGTATGGEVSGINYCGLTLQSFIQPGLLVAGNNGAMPDDGETTILMDPEDDSTKNGD